MKKLLTLVACVVLVMPLSAQTWSKALEKSAKAGDVEAQFTVGNAYLTGDGVKQNLKKATQWLFMAAQAGQADAIKTLCTYYSDALEQVAAAGNADAQFALANFYETGNGVAQNQAKALELYGSAAAQGIAEAKPKVLGSYNAGIVTLADAGDIDAATQVADYLFNGTGGATKDEAAAANYYAKAYMAGNKSAGTKLTTMYRAYLEGRGVPKNENLGYLWLAKAASAGIDEAMNKFYNTNSQYLENAANEGDVKAMVALARFRSSQYGSSDGLNWYIKAIKAGDTSVFKEFNRTLNDATYWSEEFKATDGKTHYLKGLDILKKYTFDHPISYELGSVTGSAIYFFDKVGYQGDYRINYETVKILDPNIAYYLALYEYDSDIATTLLKRLMNEFSHEGAKQMYDNYYFKYDYESYDIGSVDRYSIVGFNGLPETVIIRDWDGNEKKISSQVPTPEELQILIESLPDFAVNKDAIRVIRNFTAMENERIRWVVDIYYLPGMWTYGPDSYFEMSAEYEAYDRKASRSVSLKMSNPYKHRFGHFAGNNTEFNVTLTGTETREIAKAMDLGVDTCIYEYAFQHHIKDITTVNLEWQREIKNLKIFSGLDENSSNWSGNYFTVVDGDTLELTLTWNIWNRLELSRYTVKGQDGIEYSLMPREYHKSIDDKLPYDLCRARWYRMTYPKPDGKKMDILIPPGFVGENMDKMNFDNIKDNLNVAFLDSIFNETLDAVVIAENGEMLHYKKGLLASEYDAQKEQMEKEEQQRLAREFKEELYKKYGKQMVDRYFKSQGLLLKGVSINLVSDYIDHYYSNPREKWIEFYLTDSDGYGVYELHEGNVIYGFRTTARIYTKNNLITDWVNY